MPIMVGGMLYTPTTRHSIVALQPESGDEIWKYDLGKVERHPSWGNLLGRR